MDETPTLRVTTGSGFSGADVLRAARAAADEARVVEVGPTGHDRLEPIVRVTVDGETRTYDQQTPASVRELVDAVEAGERPDRDPVAVHGAGDQPEVTEGPLAAGVTRVLSRAGWTPLGDASALEDGVAARATDDPGGLLETVAGVGLLGRGRGDAASDESVAREWRLAREADGSPVVVVNANEADATVDGDRLLCESLPGELLDGALAAARVVGAEDVVVYCNETETVARERVEAVVESAAVPESVSVVVGPDTYTAGEPTMALESLEGNDRLEARKRPPGPAEWGLYGRPTVVHTPRTLVQVRHAVLDGVDSSSGDPGTRLVTLSGDVAARATVELPTETSLSRALPAVEGDPHVDPNLACVGGQFGGLTRSLDVPASAPALTAAGLGTNGGVELLDGTRCVVAAAGERVAFADEANCGRCVPCREGSTQMVEMLRDVYGGEYDGEGLRELGRVVRDSSLCVFGQEAARPVLSAIERFESEFRAHADGRCPAGACEMEVAR